MRAGWCAPMARASRAFSARRSVADLGERFGADLTAAEVRYLMEREWAVDADDILWRRSKLGLRLSGRGARLAAALHGAGAQHDAAE